MSEVSGEAGDLLAEGLALLSVPGEGLRGVQAIDAAASAGHPDALERRALFEAMGIARPIDWNNAIDSLCAAAEAGSASAGRQLIQLGPEGSSHAAGSTSGTDWRSAAGAIRLRERLQPPPVRTVSADPLIRTVDKLLSASECAWLIDAAKNRLEPAYVNDPRAGTRVSDPVRTNRGAAFPVPQMDCVIELIRQRLAAASGIPVHCFEVAQVLHYSAGQEFKPHHDFLDPDASGFRDEIAVNGQRVATALVYLNDGYSGGETQFPALGLKHRGRAGDAMIFTNVDRSGRPHPRTLHAGLPPDAGDKWIFSQWIREHPPGAGRA